MLLFQSYNRNLLALPFIKALLTNGPPLKCELDLLLRRPLEIDRMFQIEMNAFWLQCELTEKLKITKLGGIFYHISGSVEISGKSTLRFSMILKISYL